MDLHVDQPAFVTAAASLGPAATFMLRKPVSPKHVWGKYIVPSKHHRVGDLEEAGQRGREDRR